MRGGLHVRRFRSGGYRELAGRSCPSGGFTAAAAELAYPGTPGQERRMICAYG